MKLTTLLPYSGDFRRMAASVVAMEKAGLDAVLIPEAYANDSISRIGYLAAITERVEIGTGIVNVYTRSAALLGMTAAGCDDLTGGRFFLGLGSSGPQVIEGFHGIEYDRPLTRMRETIDVVRSVVRRDTLTYEGRTVQIPLPAGRGTGLGKPLKLIDYPVRPRVPIWWAALKSGAVCAAAEMAEGWIPSLFIPELADSVWGESLRQGKRQRSPDHGPLDIVAGGPVAIGDNLDTQAIRDRSRPSFALYIGGMGAPGRNFYNDIVTAYGYGYAARNIQRLYLEGRKDQAAAAIPDSLLEKLTLVGPPSYISERLAAYREAGVTYLNLEPATDPVGTVEQLRDLVDSTPVPQPTPSSS